MAEGPPEKREKTAGGKTILKPDKVQSGYRKVYQDIVERIMEFTIMEFTDVLGCYVRMILDHPETDTDSLFNMMLDQMNTEEKKAMGDLPLVILKAGEAVRSSSDDVKREVRASLTGREKH